ncbi:MAG: exodeoxyribonuclease V subunit alpha [Deltaproteobacteria bacterium]
MNDSGAENATAKDNRGGAPEPGGFAAGLGLVFGEFDLRFATTLLRFEPEPSAEIFQAAALASASTGSGRVCVQLADYAGRPWPQGDEASPGAGPEAGLRAPALDAWLAALRGATIVGAPGDFRPLILDGQGRLYLHRYWLYEHDLAEHLFARASGPGTGVDPAAVAASLDAIAARGMKLADGQRLAVATALLRRLTIVAGGAGTGKTTIVACILRLLAEHAEDASFRVRVAAPTGKAANRLGEQLKAARERIDPEGRIAEIVDEEPATLHRLLGGAPDGVRFRHNAANPLPLHALVIDESSMVDVALMAKVVRALPAHARLILVGDPEQLPPVEVGSVFGELVGGGGRWSAAGAAGLHEATGIAVATGGDAPLEDAVVVLDESFRFAADSGIGELAAALRAGDFSRTDTLLDEGRADLRCVRSGGAEKDALLEEIAAGYAPLLQALSSRASAREILSAMARFRVLAIRREGAAGIVGLNARIERHLRDHHGLRVAGPWYPGRMVMVTRNNHTLRLFNGDVGIALRGADGRLQVFFDTGTEPRGVAPGRLSHVETVFAMTVHKSQGSEFESVCLVLPEFPSRLLTRELLYTAATRARERLLVAGPRARWAEGLANHLPRTSALADVLLELAVESD